VDLKCTRCRDVHAVALIKAEARECLCSSNRGDQHEKDEDYRNIDGRGNSMRSSHLVQSIPRQRLVSVRELCGSKDRAAVDCDKYCGRQSASAPPGISALRIRCYLLLSSSLFLFTVHDIRGRLRLAASFVAEGSQARCGFLIDRLEELAI